jgi:ribonuclease P protein component
MKEDRLRGKKRFSQVYSQGFTRSNSLLVIKALPNGLETTRFGFAVSKKLGKAVERNKVKRRMREGVHHLPIKGGWDIIFIAKREALTTNFLQLKEGIADLLSRAFLLAG